MVVKTELCSFSGLRIYPGHGIMYVRGDQKSFKFVSRKAKSLFTQRINPRKGRFAMFEGAEIHRHCRNLDTLLLQKNSNATRVGCPNTVI